MSRHTKAPLRGKTVKVCFVEFEKLGITISIPQYADAEAKANSRRMIACFESLEGLTTEQIEEGVFQKMREHRDFLAAEVDALTKQRDELLAALESLVQSGLSFIAVDEVEDVEDAETIESNFNDDLIFSRKTIAKAKGGAA